jgi:hypothetical protein
MSLRFFRKLQLSFFTLFLFTLLFFNSTQGNAESLRIASQEDCNRGQANEQYECFLKKLSDKEKEIDELVSQSIKSYKSIWGEKANAEFRRRLLRAQEGWKKYTYNHCYADYYSMAPVHPMSHDLRYTVCKLEKAEKRIVEIKYDLLNQRPEQER